MANEQPIYHSLRTDAELAERTRETTRRSLQVLKENPKPDTFAGRKTQEPFPKEDDEIERRLNSKESQPPRTRRDSNV